jgi:crotonobetainyl-CoA:carnitine CoA-transferase CaiB-like acyl-CoA transferase
MILADQGADVIKIEPPGGDISAPHVRRRRVHRARLNGRQVGAIARSRDAPGV